MKTPFLRAVVLAALAGAMSTPAFAQKKTKRAPAKKPGAAAPAKAAPAAPAAPADAAPAEAAPAPAADAAPASSGGTYRAAYGMAGCGLGSLFIKSPDKWPQVGAWVFNSYLLPSQLFAISSGTSNCKSKAGGTALVDEQETFVSANLPRLEQEAAQGQGELLSSYAELLGCRGEAGDALRKLSQERFDYVFEKKEAESVLSRTHELLKTNAVECARV
jgi:hypothetical protein